MPPDGECRPEGRRQYVSRMGSPMTHFESLKPYTRPKRNVRTPSRLIAPTTAPAQGWPINEIILRTHVANGLDAEQIAGRYGVPPERVAELRKIFGI